MRKLRWLILAAAGFAAWFWYGGWQHWLSRGTGSYNCPAAGCAGGVVHNYNFYSGFGSDIIPAILTLAGVGLGFWWHHQCHVDGCYWYARTTTDAGDRACFLHHPERKLKMTAERLRERHHAGKPPGRG